jgi:hypothetical protein
MTKPSKTPIELAKELIAIRIETELAAANKARERAEHDLALAGYQPDVTYEDEIYEVLTEFSDDLGDVCAELIETRKKLEAAESLAAKAAEEMRERVLTIIDHGEETAALAHPGWETGYAAALRAMDTLIRDLPIEEKKDE